MDRIIYGTYKLTYEQAINLINHALTLNINNFDTAQLYGNEKAFLKINKDYNVTTKIYHATTTSQLENRIKMSKKRFNKDIDTILLHREMPNEFWNIMSNLESKIGISNYSLESLISLMDYCTINNLKKPQVIQIEVHPFINQNDLINYCKNNNIEVQGHSVLYANNIIMNDYINNKISELTTKYNCKLQQLLLLWSLNHCDKVCIGTKSIIHMEELVNCLNIVLDEKDIEEMNTWHLKYSNVLYKNAYSDNNIKIMVSTLKKDLEKLKEYNKDPTQVYNISDICDKIPITRDEYKTIGKKIAILTYPDIDPQNAHRILREDVKKLRNLKIENSSKNKIIKKGLPEPTKIRTEGPYSEFILNPRPMPVDITEPTEFEQIFNYIKNTDTNDIDITFTKGTMFKDGRLDLCKQVVGPTSIGKLCETVLESKIVEHFLLGNNVSFQDNDKKNMEKLSKLMASNNNIKTWYLAGNNINEECCKYISQGLKNNTVSTALWLKRNPIMLGTIYLNDLIRNNTTLELLDLHNCGIGDLGLKLLFNNPEEIKKLKHLYLDANAIENIDPLLPWLSNSLVESFYISINRIGSKNIIKIMEALNNNPNNSIKRLCFASTHLDNEGIKKIAEIIPNLKNLICLNLGTYKSSADLGEYPGNFYDDSVLNELISITKHPNLKYLSTSGSHISLETCEILMKDNDISMDLGKIFRHKHDLKTIKHPELVYNIDSIYRGKM
ncbi:aldo/keto reductase [Hokovirus HKV1]|uniref:Aldo/keto reductase n=1 Tax=Hokovirus HKV1 TaxID=1977638 RepID=A0A1V0SF72_9VIRU|nr:aldo/keto reductase [Hokovirus HKV1]